jgi:hypothetical protein
MVRGLESEPVQSEIDAAAGRSAALQAHVVSREALDLQRKKEGLLMARVRVTRDLERARNPRWRAVLTKALADLDAQLAIPAMAAVEVSIETSSVILSALAKGLPSEEIARILVIAGAAFDDDERAVRWLQEPNIQTGTRPPVSLIGTPEGFAAVESVLRQIQYGVFG